jgi:hypothetical protein
MGQSQEIIELMGDVSPDQIRRERVALLARLSDEERTQLRDLLHRALERAKAASPPDAAPRGEPPPAAPPARD